MEKNEIWLRHNGVVTAPITVISDTTTRKWKTNYRYFFIIIGNLNSM